MAVNYGFKLDENYIFEYVLPCSYDIYAHMFCTITAKLFLPLNGLELLLTHNIVILILYIFCYRKLASYTGIIGFNHFWWVSRVYIAK